MTLDWRIRIGNPIDSRKDSLQLWCSTTVSCKRCKSIFLKGLFSFIVVLLFCCYLTSRMLFVSRLQTRTALPLVFITLSWEDWRDWWCPLRCQVQSLIHWWNSASTGGSGGSIITCDSLVHGLLFLDCARVLVSKRKEYNKANRWDLIRSRLGLDLALMWDETTRSQSPKCEINFPINQVNLFLNYESRNSAFSSCFKPSYQSEAWCTTIYENEFNLHINETSFSLQKRGTKTRFEKEA